MSDLDFLPCVFFSSFCIFLTFYVTIRSLSTRNRIQNIAVIFKRASFKSSHSHLGQISLSELCDLGQGMVPSEPLLSHLKNRSNGRAFSGCGEEGLTAFSLPSPLCPQPSATSLVTGFLGCRLYLIEEKTKAEGIKSTVPEA